MLGNKEIFDRIRSAFADAGISPPDGELTLETNYAHLICSDRRAADLAIALGKRFGLEVPVGDVDGYETVGELVSYFVERLDG